MPLPLAYFLFLINISFGCFIRNVSCIKSWGKAGQVFGQSQEVGAYASASGDLSWPKAEPHRRREGTNLLNKANRTWVGIISQNLKSDTNEREPAWIWTELVYFLKLQNHLGTELEADQVKIPTSTSREKMQEPVYFAIRKGPEDTQGMGEGRWPAAEEKAFLRFQEKTISIICQH